MEETNSEEINEGKFKGPPAGFWLRTIAFIIDTTITYVLGIIISSAVVMLFGDDMIQIAMNFFAELLSQPSNTQSIKYAILLATIISMFAIVLTVLMIMIIIGTIYFIFFEISPLQATPGKLILGLIVVNKHFEPISVIQATLRHCMKIFSFLSFFFGFLMASFTRDKQTLHDMVAGCYVRRGPQFSFERTYYGIGIAIFCLILCYLFSSSEKISFETPTIKTNQFNINDLKDFKEEPPKKEIVKVTPTPSPIPTPTFEPTPVPRKIVKFEDIPKPSPTATPKNYSVTENPNKIKKVPKKINGNVKIGNKSFILKDFIIRKAIGENRVTLYAYNRMLNKNERAAVQAPLAPLFTSEFQFSKASCKALKAVKIRIIQKESGFSSSFQITKPSTLESKYRLDCMMRETGHFVAKFSGSGNTGYSKKVKISWYLDVSGTIDQNLR